MKKIKDYILIFVLAIMGFFVIGAQNVFAEESEEETEEVDPTENYVVINPNSEGLATYVYTTEREENGDIISETKQYTRSRDVAIGVNIPDNIIGNYETFKVCEMVTDSTSSREECSTYITEDKMAYFQLMGKNDGEKEIKITFIGVPGIANNITITKSIVLDTTGPIITLTQGEYIYIPLGERYIEYGATCVDNSGYTAGECKVEIEEATINMKEPTYQYVRYTTKDFLGNETNAVIKILVEMDKNDSRDYTYVIATGVGVVLLAALLLIQVWKNKEKQKNQSVL